MNAVSEPMQICTACKLTLRMVPGGKLVRFVRLPWEGTR